MNDNKATLKKSQTQTKVKLISRRRWLQSAMAAFAMPSLEIFNMSKALAQQDTPNLVTYYLPNGRFRDWWYPKTEGGGGKLIFPEETKAIQPWADRMAIGTFENLAALNSTPGAAHAKGTGTVLTSTANNLKKVTNNISIDQAIANHIGKESRFRSLNYTSGKAGIHAERCDVNRTACVYVKTVSWKKAGEPITPMTDVAIAFKQLFGEAAPVPDGSGFSSLNSVLDVLTKESASLKNTLGKVDQARLEQYFEGLRDIEKRIQSQPGLQCDTGNFDTEPDSADYGLHVDAFHDLIILALSCGQTKVATYMLDYGLSNRRYDFLGIRLYYHKLTHRGEGEPREQYRSIEKWQAEKYATFLRKMEDTMGANGQSLLDESVVLFMPSMGDGSSHDHNNVSPIVMGGKLTALKTDGRAIPKKPDLAALHVTLLDAFGVPGNFGVTGARFGDQGNNGLSELL